MEARQFIRHPVELPIETTVTGGKEIGPPRQAYSIGIGGLAFRCGRLIEPGTLLHLRISCVTPEFVSDARVVWCRFSNGAAELGVEFLSADDAFRMRMVEQVCQIESYRREVRDNEGRTLSVEEAALEWIDKYAAGFPALDPGRIN